MRILVYLIGVLMLVVEAFAQPAAERYPTPWLGVHLLVDHRGQMEQLKTSIPKLAKMGVNALVIEVDYNFEYASHPELRGEDFITKAQAKEVGDLCRANGIRPIPEINCLGHQSWAEKTGALLAKHPEIDETPGEFVGNKNPDPKGERFYCRSWCPSNPKTMEIVLPLVDELIDAFGADAFHVGMDEVFIIASEYCPLCKGKDPAEVYAKHVNEFHNHIVGKRKVEMFMWADRFLDAKAIGASKWEASANGTARAVDRVPKDIVMCDWHYEKQKEYPSVAFLLGKGFRVWPASWKDPAAAEMLIDASIEANDPRMMGHLSTTWYQVKPGDLADFVGTKAALRRFGKLGHE